MVPEAQQFVEVGHDTESMTRGLPFFGDANPGAFVDVQEVPPSFVRSSSLTVLH
jgi:hypothetical protein